MNRWAIRHKFGLQVGAFLIGLAAPFALHWGIAAGFDFLAIGAFAAIASSMAVVLWVA